MKESLMTYSIAHVASLGSFEKTHQVSGVSRTTLTHQIWLQIEGCHQRWFTNYWMLPTYRSSSVDEGITDDLFHGPCGIIRQL